MKVSPWAELATGVARKATKNKIKKGWEQDEPPPDPGG